MTTKPFVHVLIKNEEENYCAKCCKTRNVIEQMFNAIPEFYEKIDISFDNIELAENIEKFGNLTPPAIFINDVIFSEGHVPIMKKLARELNKIIH